MTTVEDWKKAVEDASEALIFAYAEIDKRDIHIAELERIVAIYQAGNQRTLYHA